MPKNKKPWSRVSSKRQESFRASKEIILIICEGKKTEPNYFRKFPVNKEIVEIEVEGEGKNTESLMRVPLSKKVQAERTGNPYNQIWCVFDRDSFPLVQFNSAIRIAKQQRIRVAYSNEAFELWYLLHFDYLNTGVSRKDYIHLLNKKLKRKYKKNDPSLYRELLPKQGFAIRCAEKLLSEYETFDPGRNKPSTITLYVSFSPGEQATGIELNDHILLRINEEERKAIGVTFLEYSLLTQNTEIGPRSFLLSGLSILSDELKEIVLDILRKSPVSDILSISAFTPSLVETIPIIQLKSNDLIAA